MPICKNNPKRNYKGNEPSPKGLGYCASGEKEGKVMKGKDENMWIKRNGKWMKQNSNEKNNKIKKYKKYYIHNNYDRPYLIKIIDKNVYIYESGENKDYEKLIKNYNAEKIFIGKSPKIEMTEFSAGYGKKFDGNTILLKINKNKYVLISGYGIEEFITKDDEIIEFYSPVGNNDVPYPFAIGKNYIYKLYDSNGYLSIDELKSKNLQKIVDFIFEFGPFFINLKTHKNENKITIEKFKEMRNKKLEEISLSNLKNIAKMYGVITSGSKKEIVDRIENLRGVIVYKK
jgi:hypothetical protein